MISAFLAALSGWGLGAPRLEVGVWLEKVGGPKLAAVDFFLEGVPTGLVVAFQQGLRAPWRVVAGFSLVVEVLCPGVAIPFVGEVVSRREVGAFGSNQQPPYLEEDAR